MDDYEYHNSTYSGLHDGESMHRLLASAEEEEYYVDHAVIGVFVLTLALLLMVEVIRHGLDVAARGHVFFQTVLELIYREITTLGIVELFLHILHTYEVGLNYQWEATFTQVHFMLFYTAILNAIQSCLARLVTVRRTDKTWLVAEDIEVAHYVAIRKEFDRLERKMKHLNPQYMGSLTERAWPTGGNDSQSSSRRESFKSSVSDLALRIRHPRLYRRRNELLTIIRFHELRVHFIECNNLPPNFKVSSYLDRSLRSVLVDFVHISPLAWISVMAIANLLFFIAGMILNNTHTIPTVDKFLVLTFMSLMVVFVAIMTVLYFKMRYIFYKIQHLQLDNVSDADRNNTKTWRFTALNKGTTTSFDQLDLFWGSNPRVVIVITQFLQFGYALGLAGVFSFSKSWQGYEVIAHMEFLLLIILLSYSIFIKLISDILPWYTLCTSLGQLVNKEMLDETVAKQRLSEEIRKKESIEEEKKAEEEIARRRKKIEIQNVKAASETRKPRQILKSTTKIYHNRKKVLSDGVHAMRASIMRSISNKNLVSSDSHPPNDCASQLITAAAQSEAVSHRRQLKPMRSRENRKSVSDGVALMRSVNSDPLDDRCDWWERGDRGVSSGGPHNRRSHPAAWSIKETDIVSENFEPLSNAHSDLSLELHEPKIPKPQSAGLAMDELTGVNTDLQIEKGSEKLVALSKLTQLSVKDLPEIPPFRPSKRAASEDKGPIVAADIIAGFARDQIPLKNRQRPAHVSAAVSSTFTISHQSKKSLETKEGDKILANDSFTIFSSEQPPDVFALDDDDGESDIDDVPEAILSDATTTTRQEKMKAFVRGNDLIKFFQSSQYHTISFVCGPMICFWIIAMRIEMFNVSEGLFKDQTELWIHLLEEFFWIEVSWYCLMIIEMLLVLAVFMNNRGRGGSLFSCSAAVFGLMIILLCMLLLFIAETKRCCQDNSDVAEGIHEADNGDVTEGIHESGVGHRLLASESSNNDYIDDSPLEDIACCPKFGTRKYGGLGEIEPFTSLIVLYPMRFHFASCIVALFGNEAEKEKHKEIHKWSHHHGHHGIDLDKMRTFWLTAIGIHSEVADMFGLFSGEMLQCMLGIFFKSVRDDQNSDNDNMVENQTSQDQISEGGAVHHPSRQLVNRIHSFCMSSREHRADDIVTFDDFSYPTARLIRRMRRCERILLPFLDEWTVVDAALTSHELILFNALDDGTVDSLAPGHAITNFINGGKGMHLCDIARGRKIVSQFNLDEIELLEIEHRVAITQNNIFGEDVEVNNSDNLPEYWQGGNISSEGYQVSSMNKRWRHVNEDRLKIRFKHHTLFLRFVADLKEMEQKSKVSNSGDNSSNITAHVGAEANVWCRTIARLRGVTNLRRQSLVHFGDDVVADEIKDFVKMCDRDGHDEGHNAMNFRRSFRRQSAFRAKKT